MITMVSSELLCNCKEGASLQDSDLLKSYRFVLKLHESVHKCLSAVFIKMAANMVQSLVIKMLDQPVEIIFHL